MFIGFNCWRKMVDSILNISCINVAIINWRFHCCFLCGFCLKDNFTHPMWYELPFVDGLCVNSATAVERLWNYFFRPKKCTLNSKVGLMCPSWQGHYLSIHNVICSQIHFRYASHNAIYWYTLKLFISYTILFLSSSSIFNSNLMSF